MDTFSGWALILSALIFLFGFAWDHILNGSYTLFTVMIGIIGNIGLPPENWLFRKRCVD